jgi:2-polyprenyl-3-methyl-5-hydroxy-6-metoxy-1,4-benzoquinol methylase
VTASRAQIAIELEDCPCAYCHAPGGALVLSGRDRFYAIGGEFAVVRCTRCGLMRTNPRPTARTIGAFYPEQYGPYVETAREVAPGLRTLLRRVSDPLDLAIPAVPSGRLLEIGAASGNYLLRMQRAGWAVTGIEMDAASATRAAQRTGARVLQRDLASVVFDEREPFDLICAWMVFEHLHDPVLGFRRCLEWLKPGGWLAFSVPDCGNWQFRTFKTNWMALEVPRHLYHFSAPVLQEVVQSCGYQSVAIQWQRTLFDVSMSLAFALEASAGPRVGAYARRAADSLPIRALARAGGILAAPFRWTARLTVWAQKPTRA